MQVRNNAGRSRYELVRDGDVVGIADYRVDGDRLVFPHTEISPSLRGQGLGEVLVQGAMDGARTTGLAVVPSCWFVAEFLDRHPEYDDLPRV